MSAISIRILSLSLVATVLLWTCSAVPAAEPVQAVPRIGIQIGPKASEVERYAADELAGYLDKLFHIVTHAGPSPGESADMVLLVGNPDTNPAVAKALGKEAWPKIGEQGIILKRAKLDGSPGGGGRAARTVCPGGRLHGRDPRLCDRCAAAARGRERGAAGSARCPVPVARPAPRNVDAATDAAGS